MDTDRTPSPEEGQMDTQHQADNEARTFTEGPFSPPQAPAARPARREMIVRFTDETARTLHAVEDSPTNRRTLDRMAAHLLAKSNVESIEVAVRNGRTAGYERSAR